VWYSQAVVHYDGYCCTDVGLTEPRRNVVDDAFVWWTSSACHFSRLRSELVPDLCRLHHVSHTCILRRQISVSSSYWH